MVLLPTCYLALFQDLYPLTEEQADKLLHALHQEAAMCRFLYSFFLNDGAVFQTPHSLFEYETARIVP